MIPLTARMIRAYKGAAASILILFIAEGGRPLTQAEMQRGTGYRDEAIHEAVWMLREDGLIVGTGRYTWALPPGMQLPPLGSPAAEVHPDPASPCPAEGKTAGQDHPEPELYESKNESDSIHPEDSLIPSSGTPGASASVTAEDLRTFGFYGRGIADLLAIPGLTLREVRFHVQNAPSLGAALSRIRKRQAVPAAFEVEHDDEPHTGRKYVEGKYADFICH